MTSRCLVQPEATALAPQSLPPGQTQALPHPGLQLQIAVGNQAANQLISSTHKSNPWEPANLPHISNSGASPIQAKPSFQGLSKELTAPLSTSDKGKPLPNAVRQKMEMSFQSDFSDVRIHEGPQAESIGAIAYTRGSRIHFAPDQYHPTSQSGQQLLGHELAHVVQQRSGRVATTNSSVPINADLTLETEADLAGRQAAQGQLSHLHTTLEGQCLANQGSSVNGSVVQAKLPWNRQKFEQEAGAKSMRSSAEYKSIIQLLVALDRPPNIYIQNPLYNYTEVTLQELQEACFAWLQKNQNKQSEKTTKRRFVIEQLAYQDIPREFGEVEGSYRGVLTGVSLGKGQVGSGGVKKAKFQSGRQGAFKAAEAAYDPDSATAARNVGIPAQHGSLLSNRAVATSRLDRLFKTDIIVHTEFSTVTDPQTQEVIHGIAMEEAEGVSPQILLTLEHSAGSEYNQGYAFARELNYDDPELLKQLSTLQLLDAITGQVDRHVGNYFVSQGGAQGTLVKGIDNDFAFGSKNTDVTKESSRSDKYQGFPDYVDKLVAQNIRAISEEKVRQTLRSLLPKVEVENTVQRFRQVLLGLKNLEKNGRLITGNQWNDPAVLAAHGDKTYYGAAKGWTEQRSAQGAVIAYDPNEDKNTRKTRENSYMEAYGLINLVLAESAEDIAKGKFGRDYEGFGIKSIVELQRKVDQAADILYATNPPSSLRDQIKSAIEKASYGWKKYAR